ncbi:MAG: GspH/FimT family pseudopilin [Candidatus Electrothrix sp. YB6]
MLLMLRESPGEYPSRKQREGGFSLIELMTAIAIIGITAAIALPSYISGMPHRRLKAAARDLYGAMQQARLLAVKNNMPVRVCFEKDSELYYFDTFDIDGTEDNDKVCDSGDSAVQQVALSIYHNVEFGNGGAKKKWDGDPIAKPPEYITFSRTGTANSRTAYLQNSTAPSECFAITAQTSGSLKVRWFDGEQWK